MKPRNVLTFFLIPLFWTTLACAQAPEKFVNPPENLNPNASYVPGDYVTPDLAPAIKHYKDLVSEWEYTAKVRAPEETLFKMKSGELRVTVIKNESVPVLAYFKDFSGGLFFRDGVFSGASVLISVNSWDTAVPGRDGRVKSILFQSMNLENATAALELKFITKGPADQKTLQDGALHAVETSGTLRVAGAGVSVSPSINVQWKDNQWVIAQAQPLDVYISDFGLGARVPLLMKECNHKSITNKVSLEWDLALA